MEINKIETKTKQNKTKRPMKIRVAFEKINKMDKPLARLIEEKKKKAQINKIINNRTEVITNVIGTQRIIKEYYKQFYANKVDNLKEINFEKHTTFQD